MLLPTITDESHAEAQRMHKGEGINVELAVDQAWGLNFARSLMAQVCARARDAHVSRT